MHVLLLKQIITNPNIAFERINSSNYFTFSILIFSISCIIAFFRNYYESFAYVSQELSYVMSILYIIVNFGGVFLSQILIILAIFLIGKKFDGNTDFKRTFSVLSFCVIPAILGVLIMSISDLFLHSIVFPVDASNDLSPSFALDFAFSGYILYYFITIPFLIWSAILYVKAIKILNNFSTTKSIALLVTAGLIVYGARVLYDVASSLPFLYQA